MREMTPGQLKAHLDATDTSPVLLDVREAWEFNICRLEGALLIPMGQIRNELDQLDPDRETVVICHHGIRSRVVAQFLEQMDFSSVINLAGGVAAWARDVDPNMAVY